MKAWLIVGRMRAVMLAFSCLLAMFAPLLLKPVFATIASNFDQKLEGFAQFYFAYPWVGILLGIPALAACVPLVRGTKQALLWTTVATLLALLPVGFLFAAFYAVVSPMYSATDL